MIHCDRGSTYINPRWCQAVKAKNLIQSYSAKASPQQNACMETCWSSSLYLTQPQHLQRDAICQMIHKYFKHYNYNREMKFNNWLTPLAKKHKYYQKLKKQLSPSHSPK